MVHEVVSLRVRIAAAEGWYPNIGSVTPKGITSKPPTYPVHLSPRFNLKLQ